MTAKRSREPKVVRLDRKRFLIHDFGDDERGLAVSLEFPETETHLGNEEPLGHIKQREDGLWDASNENQKWIRCATQADVLRHLYSAFEQKQQAEKWREDNRGPNALFKTTLRIWTTSKPDVGRNEEAWETIRRIDSDFEPVLMCGPDVELVEDPASDSDDGRLLGIISARPVPLPARSQSVPKAQKQNRTRKK